MFALSALTILQKGCFQSSLKKIGIMHCFNQTFVKVGLGAGLTQASLCVQSKGPMHSSVEKKLVTWVWLLHGHDHPESNDMLLVPSDPKHASICMRQADPATR